MHCYCHWKDNVKHLIMLRKIHFYKHLRYSSDVFIHSLFCTFLYNNCDDGILFKPVFYCKSEAILSVQIAFQSHVLYNMYFGVFRMFYYYVHSFSCVYSLSSRCVTLPGLVFICIITLHCLKCSHHQLI